MKLHTKCLLTALSAALLLITGCAPDTPAPPDPIVTTAPTVTQAPVTDAATTDAPLTTVAPDTTAAPEISPPCPTMPTTMPRTDGSTSTLPLDRAIHRAVLGLSEAEATAQVAHTKTYTSLLNLANGKCDVIFRTPMSANEVAQMAAEKFNYEEKPIAGEGFVFVVNRDNPVDSLTETQLRDIYAGKITNWREVGGDDLPIIPYQRNADSGSQNYMLAFMGDTPLMKPITEALPATMAGILDAVANYDNAAGAIGYSVYAYSDGMYADMAKIKHIKVNGVAPTLANMADGSYPLLGYNYAVYAADQPADSPVRQLVEWLQSDEGQQLVVSAGYVPYRSVAGLTLPEPNVPHLYTAIGCGEGQISDADYAFTLSDLYDQEPIKLVDPEVNRIIRDYVAAEQARLDAIPEEELAAFRAARQTSGVMTRPNIRYTVKNGYLSILSSIEYIAGDQDAVTCYYKPVGTVFDLYTGRQLSLADLFPTGEDFLPQLNARLAREAALPYSGFGMTHAMIREFNGLIEGEFTFTLDSIIFYPDQTFVEGVELSMGELTRRMVTTLPRDMQGLIADGTHRVCRNIHVYSDTALGTAVQRSNGNESFTSSQAMTFWQLDADTGLLDPAVCRKLNRFADRLYDEHLAPERLLAQITDAGIAAADVERYGIGPWADYDFTLHGRRYLVLSGANQLSASLKSGGSITLDVIANANANPYYFSYYFSAETGEPLTFADLFTEGWTKAATVYPAEAPGALPKLDPATAMTGAAFFSGGTVGMTIVDVSDYDSGLHLTDPNDLQSPAVVRIRTADGSVYRVHIPRAFIR